mgnify:CR=1 FL=1
MMLEKFKSYMLTKLFTEWVSQEFDVETLEMSKLMIQQRQDVINQSIDNANRIEVIGFRKS